MGEFTCPRCGMTSAHPEDLRWGYCGNCHDYTGRDWPTCGDAVKFLGFDLRCTLPKGHAHDGEQMHRNDEGVEWRMTFRGRDGRWLTSR